MANHQYQELKEVREKTGESVSGMVREAVCRFVEKKDYPVGMISSYLRGASRDDYRAVTAYLRASEWNFLEKISKNTGRCRTELVRKAVEEYLRKSL